MKTTRSTKMLLLAATALTLADGGAAWAEGTGDANDIVVTARRIEEKLQDVPISITVYNQSQLANNNATSMKDLASFTPGLQINSRYGADSTNFSIRGFTQEQRTSATVGVYFADVVAPRGSGGTFGGDGAGPGALFDLQNVQVLKGPQGTLFGRNTTGGNVMLVPNRPTGKLEGYVEGGLGNYNMQRIQAVLNVPVMDSLRVRFGMDHQKRDGYLNNIGTLGDGIHPGKGMGDVDYWAGRFSMVADLSPNVENYLIATYSDSSSNGNIPKLIDCSQSISSQNFGVLTQARCQAQIAREAGLSPWTVENRLPDSQSRQSQWQVINNTTWQASDNLTVKNIISYAEFRQRTNLELFGNYYLANGVASATSGAQVTGFAFTHANPYNHHTNAQSTFTEEFRLQGTGDGGKLKWQTGFYMEMNDPLGFSGVQTATGTACADIDSLNCVSQPGFSLGSINVQLSNTKFSDYAVYGQATYEITPRLNVTGGLRYTWDKESTVIQLESISAATPTVATCANANAPGFGTPFPVANVLTSCQQSLSKSTKAPTWLINLDYKPIDDVMLYAKYARGYRQGGLSLFGPGSAGVGQPDLQPYDKEKVDAYEVGFKSSWRGALPGMLNVSAFYNFFTSQQLLLGAIIGSRPNALVANAGQSHLKGIEVDFAVRPVKDFKLSVSYSYLDSKIISFTSPNVGSGVVLTPPQVGDFVPNTQPHKLNISGEWRLSFIPESVGKISIGASYIWTSAYEAVAPSCPGPQFVDSNGALNNSGCFNSTNNTQLYIDRTTLVPTNTATANTIANPGLGINNVNPRGGWIDGYGLVNMNVNWEKVAGLPVDLGFFVSNLTNKAYYVSINDNTSRSFRSGLLGEPRMWGFRLKYKFGGQ